MPWNMCALCSPIFRLARGGVASVTVAGAETGSLCSSKPRALPRAERSGRCRDASPAAARDTLCALCRRYADHHDVQVALAVVQHLHPERRMSIGVTPLGTALAMSEGWGTGLPDAPLRLQASTTVLRATKEELEPLPDSLRQALNARTSAFPLFLMEELQSASASPVFLRREDLVACWQASGRPAAAMPSSLIMYDLRVLCVKMMSTPADWRSLVFVAPQPSMQVVDGTRQHPAVAELEREAAASRGDEPPPLEASVPG